MCTGWYIMFLIPTSLFGCLVHVIYFTKTANQFSHWLIYGQYQESVVHQLVDVCVRARSHFCTHFVYFLIPNSPTSPPTPEVRRRELAAERTNSMDIRAIDSGYDYH
ncbi:hypothetical protein LSH36_21g01025 [Paralvinella palmiformis]|uniref:Uncharacterized protein n=1 Tax=Paralvinella palmiformis TaxID=53620 RepID=A0AAD9KAA6_9ANNE|nr:hypothetical protein LSH36_21g01025 [Paralvinella palmiformis]